MARRQRSLEVRLAEKQREADMLETQKKIRDLQDKMRAQRGR